MSLLAVNYEFHFFHFADTLFSWVIYGSKESVRYLDLWPRLFFTHHNKFYWNSTINNFYKMMWMLFVLWLVVVYHLLEYRCMDDVRLWKCWCHYFGLRKWKRQKKWAGTIKLTTNNNKKNGETETKRVLNNLRMPKLQEILTTVTFVNVWIFEWKFSRNNFSVYCFLFVHS